MKSAIGQLSKDTVIYGLGGMLRRSVGFLLIPVYTRFLNPSDYGYLELLSIITTVLTIVGSQGLGTAFFRQYVEIEKDETNSELNSLISSVFLYLSASSLFLLTLIEIASGKIGILIVGKSEAFGTYLRIVAVASSLAIIGLVPLQYLRARLESAKYTVLSVAQFLVLLTANIIFVAFLRLGVEGILLGSVIGNTIAVLAGIYILRDRLELKVSKSLLRSLLAFGLPLIPSALSLWVLQVSDRFLLQKLASASELGLYALGSRFASLITIGIITPFSMAWGPLSFQLAKAGDGRQTLKKVPTYLLLLLCWAGLSVTAFARPVIQLAADRSFWEASRVVFPLVCANVSYGMYLVFAFGSYYARKTERIAGIVVLGSAANIASNILLIPRYGMMGAAVASVLSYLLIVSLTYAMSQRLYYIPFEKLRLLKVSLVFGLFSSVAMLTQVHHLVVNLVLKATLVVTFPIVLVPLRFYSKTEMSTLYRLLRTAHHRGRGLVRLEGFIPLR